MPDYKTGSYIIRASKEWECQCCHSRIKPKTIHFARVKEYGEELMRTDGKAYRLKNYYRFHLNCAKSMADINDYEKSIIFSALSEPAGRV